MQLPAGLLEPRSARQGSHAHPHVGLSSHVYAAPRAPAVTHTFNTHTCKRVALELENKMIEGKVVSKQCSSVAESTKIATECITCNIRPTGLKGSSDVQSS